MFDHMVSHGRRSHSHLGEAHAAERLAGELSGPCVLPALRPVPWEPRLRGVASARELCQGPRGLWQGDARRLELDRENRRGLGDAEKRDIFG